MNCILIDDEYPAIEELKYFIEEFSSINIEATFENSVEALQFLQAHTIDIVFLDINMPKLDGMTLCRVINTLKVKPIVIFISAHSHYALEAFEVNAFDYLLKPYSEKRILDLLKKLEDSRPFIYNNRSITLWQNEKFIVVEICKIYYCKANKHEINVYTIDGEYKVQSCLTDFYNKLPQNIFFKSHRSYIVNLEKINEIIPWFNNTFILKLKGLDEEIPVSRHNLKSFKSLMGI